MLHRFGSNDPGIVSVVDFPNVKIFHMKSSHAWPRVENPGSNLLLPEAVVDHSEVKHLKFSRWAVGCCLSCRKEHEFSSGAEGGSWIRAFLSEHLGTLEAALPS